MINFHEVTYAYPNGRPVFDRFSGSIERGAAWAVVGASGCGKTTLLMMLAGLRRPTHGSITINAEVIDRPRPQTGLVLQDYGLLPWATIAQNVALGLRLRNYYGPDGRHAPIEHAVGPIDLRVNQWLKRLGIDTVRNHFPAQVSGGQRQRTAIARTLCLDPDLLLMDEPFSALDAPTREDLQNLTIELQREQNLTLLVVTHNIEDAVFIGQKILVLGQPPHIKALIVENPQAGDRSYRSSPKFFEMCTRVRELLTQGITAFH
ncbi:MAG TPA: ATP-binding cassette domain-containing protein [Anaerolineae bacterium]|nr:ATP-binding cassette domain-containing protein [Anaerolineae bacterium]